MKTLFDSTPLKARITERFDSQRKFAEAVRMGYQQVNRRLNNKAEFTIDEIASFASVLEISKDDIDYYFFSVRA